MVCSERWDEGGAHVIHPLEISQELIALGHEVRLFIPEVKKLAQPISVPYEMVPAPRWFKGSSFLFFELLLPFRLARHIRKAKYQNKKVVIYTRHRELGLSSLILKDMLHVPFVDEYNDIVTETMAFFAKTNMYKGLMSRIKTSPFIVRSIQALEKLMFRQANAIVAVTPELKQYIIDISHVPAEKVTVIPNGCNIRKITLMDKQTCRERLNLSQDRTYLCHIGSLNPWQGVDDVIDALELIVKELPQTTLLLVGEGPYRQTLEQRITEKGLKEHVLFTGHLPHEQVNLYLGASDVCMFLKTITSYGLSSLKLYEYMASGKPIIGRDIPSLQFIKDNDIGTLLPVKAPASQIKDCILAFLKRPDLHALEQRTRHLAETTYNWGRAAKKIEEICFSI